MKNIFLTTAICVFTIILAAGFLSCRKTLDVAPYNSFTDATAFTSSARVEAAVNGVYDAAQSGFYAGGAVRGYPFGAANVEQGDMRGEDMLNDALFYQGTYETAYNPSSANQEFMFSTLYALINRCNLVIKGVNDAVTKNIITAAKGNQYIGECRFLRAMAHHELLINYARPYSDGNGSKQGIIYRDFPVALDEELRAAKALTRTNVAENYAKILEDLDYAEANLPAIVPDLTGAGIKTFRAAKAAVIALKMRVKLHKGDWAAVITEGNKLVPLNAPFVSPVGGWKLTTNPGDPFMAPWNSDESIFSVKNAATDNGGVNGGMANMFGSPESNGRGLVKVSPVVFNLPQWKCDDKRRSLLISYTATGKTNYFTTKYKDAATSTDACPQIRYAEVLLMLAEAESRNIGNVSSRAIDLLNAVRNRSLASPAAQQYILADFVTKNDLTKAILAERRIEFIAEGKRWADIHRLATDPLFSTNGIPAKIGTGSATTTMYSCGAGSSAYTTAIGAIPYADFRFIWPVPLSEIQQNPNYTQNPGY
ncbi:MAG: RagB/SusD family nutrient uptake outer membrane protein [Bacteroidota bacterium]